MTALPDLPGVYNLIAFDHIGSTNDEAKRLAGLGEDECPDGTLVWAKSQSAARGRRGRTWESLDGNLFLSLVLRPDVPIMEATQLGYVAALAVYDTIAELCPAGYEAQCKWPNDVLLNDKKFCGILLEASSNSGGVLDWLVLGLGINVAQHPDDSNLDYATTSFHAEGATDITREQTLVSFARNFLLWTRRWLDDGFSVIRENWVWRAKGIDQEIEVRLEYETLSGIFAGIDENGALLLRQGAGNASVIKTITVGDVFFPAPPIDLRTE